MGLGKLALKTMGITAIVVLLILSGVILVPLKCEHPSLRGLGSLSWNEALADSTLVIAEKNTALATFIDDNPAISERVKNFGAHNSLWMSDNNQGKEGVLYKLSTFAGFPSTSAYNTDSVFLMLTSKATYSQTPATILSCWRMLVTWVEGVENATTAIAGDCSWECSNFPTTWNGANVRMLGAGVERTNAVQTSTTMPNSVVSGDTLRIRLPATQFDSLRAGTLTNNGYMITTDSTENNNGRVQFFSDDDATGNTAVAGNTSSGQPRLCVTSIAGIQAGDRVRLGRTKPSSTSYIVSSTVENGTSDTIVCTVNLSVSAVVGDSVKVMNQPEIWWYGSPTGAPGAAGGQRRARMIRKGA